MTDFEMVYMFSDYMNLIFTVFMGHVSIVFAFLIAGFLVAGRLEKSMVSVVVILFTIAVSISTFIQNRFGGAMIGVAGEMRKAVQRGESTLSWHSVTYEPEVFLSGFMLILSILMILSYLGALIFFFHRRRIALAAG